MRGYFGIGIENIKTEANIGTLMRSSYAMGASFVFTIGRRYARIMRVIVSSDIVLMIWTAASVVKYITYQCR